MANPEWTAEEAAAPDPSWHRLYRAGAVAAGLAVVAYLVALALYIATPVPPTEGGAAILAHVAAHRTAYLIKQVLWIAPNLFMMVVVLALAAAGARADKSIALLGGVVSVAAWAAGIAWPTNGEGSLALVVLSDRYVSAATDAARAPFVAGAELLLALNGLPAVFIGVLQTLGIVLLAVPMLKGAMPLNLARASLATGALGVAAEALRPQLGWAYAIYGLVLFAWLIWIGLALWRLGGAAAPGAALRRVDASATPSA